MNLSTVNVLSYLTTIYLLIFVKSDTFPFKFEHVTILDKNALDEFRNSANVRAVYYFKRDMARLRTFMKEYEKSAEFLEVYGVKFGVYDCRSQPVEEEVCGTDTVEHNIYTYRQGATLLQLELQTMFDVNSIMSNILQLVLLREVPILQRREEREDFEYRNRGVRDIIFTFQKAIGTYEHRIFMEVAYAYSDNFQFALSTSKQSLQNFDDMATDDSVIWVLQCKDSKKVDPCPKIRYYGYMDLASLAQFVRALTFPKQFDIPLEGTTSPYAQTDSLNVIYMYYKTDSRSTVMDIAGKLAKKYRGIYGVVTVDIEAAEPPYPFKGETPAVGILIEGEVSPVFFEEEVTEGNIFKFVSKTAENYNNMMAVGEGEDLSPTADGQEIQSMSGGDSDLNPFDESEILAVETQDDQVAEAVFNARKSEMDLTLVPKLTDKTFSNTIQHKDLLFILFYLPFDDKSMAFLRLYGAASRQLEFDPRNPLARVDCHDWTDVCSRENVTIFPTLRIYRNGEKLRNYKGMLDTQNVVNTVKLLNHTDMVDLHSVSAIQSFLLGNLPSGTEIASDSVVLGLFEPQHKKEMDVFMKVGKEMEDRIMFGINKNGEGASLAKENFDVTLPAVIVMRRTDLVSPHTVYKGDYNYGQLETFITRARIPTMPELTVKMFPDLYRQKKPFVISFLDDEDLSKNVKDTLSSIVKSEQFKEVIFCWIRTVGEGFGTKILKKYNPEGSIPAISFVNLHLGEVFNYDQATFGSDELVNWLEGSLRGKSNPNTILPQGEWKPLKEGYNFLAMMDWETRNKKKVSDTPDYLVSTEEYGIGFDEEGNEVKRMEDGKDEMSSARIKSAYEEDQVRHELLALKKSRLYHHSGGRRKMHDEEGSGQSKVNEDQVKVTEGQETPEQDRHEEL
ncbi:thioredoxin domain-containing protein 16-like [Pecten maximus]|uniref:thioredoxin domain-containing protein 16-like n=1 Tax=Pecten maximus TaxID=6579 RepID=UPI001458A1A4|nr:thioredoxin domain-containing protein 16-like [Pecten maximus]